VTKKSYQQTDAEIIAALDLQSEFAAMGVRFSGPPRQSGKAACYAMGRDDRHPSAWVDLKTGRYGDSGGGVADFAGLPRSMSLWDFAVAFGGRPDWQTARREFAKKAGVKIGTAKPPENWRERLEFQTWDAPGNLMLVQRWCLRKRGVTAEAIRAAGGELAYYPCFRDDATGEIKRRRNAVQVVALPCYGERLLDADPVAWVIWDLTGAELEVFRGKDVPKGKAKMLSIGPTSGTMMGLHGLQRLTDESLRAAVKIAWKTAGPSDMLATWAAIPAELRDAVVVVTNASGEVGDVTAGQAKLFAGLSACVAIDGDAAGQAGGLKWFAALKGVASEVLTSPSKLMVDVVVKDSRDFLGGKKE